MTEPLVIKLICSSHGAMDYGELVDIGSGLLDVKGVIDTVISNDQFCVVTQNGNKRVFAKTKVRLCKARECTDCRNLHLCKFYLYGDCKSSMGRRGCRFCHDMDSEHNARVLRDNNLHELDRTELCTLLLQNDNTLLPPVCFSYNKGDGQYGNCSDQESCRRLHICDRYLRGTCSSGVGCLRSHDFFEPHPQKTLQERGVPSQLIGSMLSVYQNIQVLKNTDNNANRNQQTHAGKANSRRNDPEKTEICLYFVKGACKQGDRCWRDHSSMPYKWEVRSGDGWTALPDNEEIEKDFCDPAKVYSRGVPPIYFDTMTRGSARVRRLSTVSSVVQPTFVLTTVWAWYWQNEYDDWIRYASLERQHRLSSITSEDLEKKYQEDNNAVVEYTAGSQAYALSFPDMIQTNKEYGTKRLVRRRPEFVSAADAQKARANKNRPGNNFKAVPGYWDKSLLPETGYKKIPLQDSSEEYKKILDLFQKTMRGYEIRSVERVQNRALWEVFQWQRDLMRKNNTGKNVSDRLLFHGTDSKHIDAICNQNFDWRICGTHGTAFGKGSYFARDAKYSHSYTGSSGVRTMFVCRVLVGCYTKGNSSYLRPPSRDGGDSVFYDSCVDDVHNPSIFVVFEKHQVYPEYIIKYDEEMCFPSAFDTVSFFGPTHTISKPVQAPPLVSTSSVTPKPVQAPPTVTVIPKPVQAPPTVSVIPKPVQAPSPVSTSSVAPPLVSPSSHPLQAPTPVRNSSVISKPTQTPSLVQTSSVTPKPMQASRRTNDLVYYGEDFEAGVSMFSGSPIISHSSGLTSMSSRAGTVSSSTSHSDSSSRLSPPTATSAYSPPSHYASRYSLNAAAGTSSQSGTASGMTRQGASSLSGSGSHLSRSTTAVNRSPSQQQKQNAKDKDCTIL